MRKIFCYMAALLAANLAGIAYGNGYLTFEEANGNTQSIAAESLTITFDGGTLLARNGNTELSIPLDDLAKMYFTSDATAITTAKASASGTVKAYTLSGIQVGEFESAEQAKETLPSGFYLLKTGSSTEKTIIK